MKTFDEMEYHPASEKLVQILCSKTQNSNPLFFRVLVGYYFSLVASMMRTTIATHDRGDIPVNMYALNLSCLLYTSPSPRDVEESRMPSSA